MRQLQTVAHLFPQKGKEGEPYGGILGKRYKGKERRNYAAQIFLQLDKSNQWENCELYSK